MSDIDAWIFLLFFRVFRCCIACNLHVPLMPAWNSHIPFTPLLLLAKKNLEQLIPTLLRRDSANKHSFVKHIKSKPRLIAATTPLPQLYYFFAFHLTPTLSSWVPFCRGGNHSEYFFFLSNSVYIGLVLSMIFRIHWRSWNISLADKREQMYMVIRARQLQVGLSYGF